MKFYQELTDWNNGTPNHIYLLNDDKTKAVAYVPVGSSEVITFKVPLNFDTRRRKFKQIPNSFNYEIPADRPRNQHWIVEGSRGSKYSVQMVNNHLHCSCPGFLYRSKCRHVAVIEEKIKQ